MPSSTVGAVIVAAGSGERLGESLPKALVELAGQPLVAWAVHAVLAAGIREVVITAPATHLDEVRQSLRAIIDSVDGGCSIVVVAGGATRSASVGLGLAALGPKAELIAIHDAARPLMPPSVIRAAIDAIGGEVLAAAPALPVVDTIKRVGPTGEIRGTVARDDLVAIQTPQVFTRAVLEAVRAWAGERDFTDDLGLFEAAIGAGAVRGRAVIVPGSHDGDKVTHPHDLQRLSLLLSAATALEPQS